MMDEVTAWIRESAFARDLAVGVEKVGGESVRLLFPHDDRHGAGGALRTSSSGKSGMHGGATASLVSLASHAAVRVASRDFESALSTVSLHIGYVRAARSSLAVETRTVRSVRELVFLETKITGEDGALVAEATSVVRAGAPEEPKAVSAHAVPQPVTDTSVLPLFRAAFRTIPFVAQRELDITGASLGRVDLTLGAASVNLACGGALHEGAVLTLIDAAGATAPWTVAMPSARATGATVALSAHFVAPLPADGVIARATVRAADARMCWTDVAVLGRTQETVHAFGTVTYRYEG